MLSFGSVCSGIEAASVAWAPLGWKAAWLSEIDRAACEVLAHRFPDTPNHGDMLGLAAKVRAREIVAPDLLVGGTPCQSFSVAGMRKGLDDPRGQLTIAFIDLANAIDEIRVADGLPPVMIVWENVPGVLTHKDNPLGCFLAGLAGEDDVLVPAGRKWTNAGGVFGPQRTASWRVLDAQYFGLAQRRRRVFVVASAREGFDPTAVLLEFDGVRRDSPPSRETGEGVAGTLDARTDGGGFPGTDGACSGHVVPAERPAHSTGLTDDIAPVPTWWDGRDVSQTLDAVLHKGQTMPEKNRFPAVLQPIGFYPTNRAPEDGNCTDLSPTITAGNGAVPGIAYSVALRGREGGATAELGDDLAGCLRASTGGGDKPHVLAPVDVLPFDATQITSAGNYSRPKAGDTGHPLAAGAHPPAVCVTGSVTHTLKGEGFDASEDGTGRGQPIVAATMENDDADAAFADTVETLLLLREQVGEEAFTEWGLGVVAALRTPQVLRSRLHGFGLRPQTDDWDILGDHSLPRSEVGSGWTVQQVWQFGCPGRSPSGREPSEQLARQLGTHLQKLSHSGAQRSRILLALRSSSQGLGLLLNALAEIQEAWRPEHLSDQPAPMMMVRRLMPVETEILQGFPPDWTKVPVGKNKDGSIRWAADGPRYKQCGNSMAVNVMAWIGRRIAVQLGHNGGPPLEDPLAAVLG